MGHCFRVLIHWNQWYSSNFLRVVRVYNCKLCMKGTLHQTRGTILVTEVPSSTVPKTTKLHLGFHNAMQEVRIFAIFSGLESLCGNYICCFWLMRLQPWWFLLRPIADGTLRPPIRKYSGILQCNPGATVFSVIALHLAWDMQQLNQHWTWMKPTHVYT